MPLPNALLAAYTALNRPAGSRFAVGLSGGLDSVALLHALTQLQPQSGFALSAIHVHHGLMPAADAWTEFCADLCRQWAVPLTVARVQVDKSAGRGIEAAARQARYAAFANLDAEVLALAHHRDDQAETLLLNLIRGAGVKGAAAMPACRPLAGQHGALTVWRPLLDLGRADLAAYAERHDLRWIEDDSNLDPRFARNYLRHEILPRLGRTFNGAASNLARSAAQFGEAAGLLDDLAALDFAQTAPLGRIQLKSLLQLSPARCRNLLRWEFARQGCAMPEAKRLEEGLRQMGGLDDESNFEFKLDQATLHAWRGELYFDRPPGSPPQPVIWRGELKLPWAGGWLCFEPVIGQGLCAAKLAASMAAGRVLIRPRAAGDRLRPHAHGPQRSLKNLCQEHAVPPWLRPRLPLIQIGPNPAWAAGLGQDAGYHCQPGEPGWQIQWQR